MGSPYNFPNAYINLKDVPRPPVADPTVLPLHLPLFGVFAETGPVGVPNLGGTIAQTALFGSGFLDERSPYYQHPNVFAARALQFQQIYLVRLADPAAVAATLVLLCTVTPGTITQYQRTVTGAIVYNAQGQPTPELQADNVTVVTQPGVTLTYTTRALAADETLNTVQTVTSSVGGVTSTTYPLLAFQTYVGAFGNNQGFRLFYDPSFNASAVSNIGAMTYSFQPVTLSSSTNIASPIYDIYNRQTQTFAFRPGAVDPTTDTYYSLADVIKNAFNGLNGLPYQFHVYGANAGAIGQAVLDVSPELTGTSPYLINIMTGADQAANPYEHAVIAPTATGILNANVVLYLEGGTDGSLTKETLETQTIQLLSGNLNPLIGDKFRYPFTHFYDSGFALPVKQDSLQLFALRDDVGIDLSTQDVALPANTAAQDQSTGSALRTTALLYPESTDLGTQACRVSIFQQCAQLVDTQIYKTIVPATLDRMLKRCMFNGTDHVTGEPKGRPNSEVTVFDITTLNWTPATPPQMQLNWSTGLNYIQYCDVAKIFYPDLLSVYPIDSSLLSSAVLTDYAAIYLKHIIRRQWTIIVGRDDPPKTLFQSIAKAIDATAAYAFSGAITTSTVVSQTAVDTALGYQLTVTTTVTGNMPNRVWQVIVPITQAS
jgi:hypothetical protein